MANNRPPSCSIKSRLDWVRFGGKVVDGKWKDASGREYSQLPVLTRAYITQINIWHQIFRDEPTFLDFPIYTHQFWHTSPLTPTFLPILLSHTIIDQSQCSILCHPRIPEAPRRADPSPFLPDYLPKCVKLRISDAQEIISLDDFLHPPDKNYASKPDQSVEKWDD